MEITSTNSAGGHLDEFTGAFRNVFLHNRDDSLRCGNSEHLFTVVRVNSYVVVGGDDNVRGIEDYVDEGKVVVAIVGRLVVVVTSVVVVVVDVASMICRANTFI